MTRWATVDEDTGDVTCPECGRLAPKIVDYGLYDDDTFFFKCVCKKCGTKSVYLTTTDFNYRFTSEDNFAPLKRGGK